MKKIIIIGASSGIGKALAEQFSAQGWTVGLTARREQKLEELKVSLPNPAFVKRMDVAELDPACQALKSLIDEMEGVEVIVINSGIGNRHPTIEDERAITQINAAGFASLARFSFDYFREKGGGQIVGVSSILALKGMRHSVVYSATKAYASVYMEGLRHKSVKGKLGITVTDIRPGFIETPMTDGAKGMFWVAKVELAAQQMYRSIIKRKAVVYVTRRWWLIAWVMKRIPRWLHHRV